MRSKAEKDTFAVRMYGALVRSGIAEKEAKKIAHRVVYPEVLQQQYRRRIRWALLGVAASLASGVAIYFLLPVTSWTLLLAIGMGAGFAVLGAYFGNRPVEETL